MPRFAPTAPGGSVFKAPTYIENPGPGTHFKSLKFQGHPKSTDAKRAAYGSKVHGDLTVIPKAVPNGIPNKKLAPQSYSGNGQDTVGPALYNPKVDITREASREPNFVASKTKRTLFDGQQRDQPGPGKYDPVLPVDNKMFNSSGNQAIFTSKVPNCADAVIKSDKPPVGTYNTSTLSRTGDPAVFGSRMSANGNEEQSQMSQTMNPFLSGTGRADMWKNDMRAPFTRQSYLRNPGPAHYYNGK
jgi:hypothetical protein